MKAISGRHRSKIPMYLSNREYFHCREREWGNWEAKCNTISFFSKEFIITSALEALLFFGDLLGNHDRAFASLSDEPKV